MAELGNAIVSSANAPFGDQWCKQTAIRSPTKKLVVFKVNEDGGSCALTVYYAPIAEWIEH